MRSIFDQFAPSLEQHLESLDYTLPHKLGSMLLDVLGYSEKYPGAPDSDE